jgi:predicted dinucleotide-utilizing enzyme
MSTYKDRLITERDNEERGFDSIQSEILGRFGDMARELEAAIKDLEAGAATGLDELKASGTGAVTSIETGTKEAVALVRGRLLMLIDNRKDQTLTKLETYLRRP